MVAAAGTALFIWLHHLGNQIPYELAQQRFAEVSAEVARPGGTERYFQGKRPLLAQEFCFITGMLSSFLWLSDGHNSLAIALIGLVAWLGHERTNAGGETQRAVRCTLLYIAGFVILLVLGQVAKYGVLQLTKGSGGYIFGSFLEALSHRLDQASTETLDPLTHGEAALVRVCDGCGEEGWQKLPIVRDFRGLALLAPFGQGVHTLLNAFSALALTCAVGGAVWQARHGRRRLANNILWLIALALMASTQFFLPNDIPFRNARFVFLLLATCWGCLALATLQLNRKHFSILAGCLVLGLFISVTTLDRFQEWRLDRTIAKAHLVVQADFDVYDDYHQLIYLKEDCDDTDIEPQFFLHIRPVDRADLPEHRQNHSFDNLDFSFHRYGTRVGGRCFATRSLPDYEIASVRTGQYVSGTGQIWRFEFRPRSSPRTERIRQR